jgi:hypothetical protein
MNAIEFIVASALLDFPSDNAGKLTFHLKEGGELIVKPIGNGPNQLPAVSVSFFDSQNLFPTLVEMHFEITDLGWVPYFFRNDFEKFEGSVFQHNEKGEMIAINHEMKRRFFEIFESWEAQILEYGIENFLPVAGGAL